MISCVMDARARRASGSGEQGDVRLHGVHPAVRGGDGDGDGHRAQGAERAHVLPALPQDRAAAARGAPPPPPLPPPPPPLPTVFSLFLLFSRLPHDFSSSSAALSLSLSLSVSLSLSLCLSLSLSLSLSLPPSLPPSLPLLHSHTHCASLCLISVTAPLFWCSAAATAPLFWCAAAASPPCPPSTPPVSSSM